ncbi:hypothetical protein LCGC14_0298180 [marine sediment metagenome]|uniref:YopX protein domain-containing protein n=1 Tax=marine sediment metagenome TaxID=412755 RepID=A0A0F9TW70_9ZZZZ
MTRELKFRAWDQAEKKWIPGGYGFHITGEAMMLGGLFQDRCLGELDDVEITQWTGLLDKNGKEIFEGDIVATGTSEDHVLAVVRFGKGERICWHYDDHKELEFHGWYLEGLIDCEDELYNREMIIVGNVYENPSLVEDRQRAQEEKRDKEWEELKNSKGWV